MIVADTCLIVHLFNETSRTDLANRILEKDSSWICPSIWQEEYANVISKLARKDNANPEDVIKHFRNTISQISPFEKSVQVESALKISLEFGVSVYDAHFISLASEMGLFLITEDVEILKKCPQHSLSFDQFLLQF